MLMNRLLALFTLAALLFPQTGIACRCKEPATEAAYEKADLVVQAKALDIIEVAEGDGITAVLAISKSWKKPTRNKITVNSLTSCYYPIVAGEEHVLFLTIEPNGLYSTGRCYGNKITSQASTLIRWLEQKSGN